MVTSRWRRAVIRATALAASLALLQSAQTARSQATPTGAETYIWDLSPLFASDAAWEAERSRIAAGLKPVSSLAGTMHDLQTFTLVMRKTTDLRQRVANLVNYALLESLLDVKSERAQARYASAASLESSVAYDVAFVGPDVRRLGVATVERYLHVDPALRTYRHRLYLIFHDGKHALPTDAARIVAGIQGEGGWPGTYGDVRQMLVERQVRWKTMPGRSANPVVVDADGYDRVKASGNAVDRRQAAVAYFSALQAFSDTFAVLLTDRIRADRVIAGFRRFDSALQEAQFDEGMPASATEVMVASTRGHLDLLRRYLSLRAQAVGVASPTFFDRFARAPQADRVFTVREALDIAVAAAAPLGTSYQARMRAALARPWLHLPPWENKRDTYGAWGNFIGGKPSFGFMRYQGSYADASRLAGLAFSMMVKASMPATEPTDQREDPGIYGNAVLMAGRSLQNDYLVAHANSKRERAAYLIADLDRMVANSFDDVLWTEFAASVETQMQSGNIPTSADLTERCLRLFRTYYGNDVPDLFGAEWLAERYLYYGDISQHFPASAAAAALLVAGARRNDPQILKGFDDVRGRIDSDLSYDLLKAAGIDLATPAPYDAQFARIQEELNELEATL